MKEDMWAARERKGEDGRRTGRDLGVGRKAPLYPCTFRSARTYHRTDRSNGVLFTPLPRQPS